MGSTLWNDLVAGDVLYSSVYRDDKFLLILDRSGSFNTLELLTCSQDGSVSWHQYPYSMSVERYGWKLLERG